MNIHSVGRRSLLVLVALLGMLQIAAAINARTPKVEELAGSWLGVTDRFAAVFLIELHPDGTGRCLETSVGASTTVHRYEIQSWSLAGWKLDMKLTAASPDAPTIRIQGKAAGDTLQLGVRRTSDGVVRKLRLFRKEALDAGLARLGS